MDALKPLPYGINIDEDGVQTQVLLRFEHLPPQFCMGCRRLGHKVSSCDDNSSPPLAAPPASEQQSVPLMGPSEKPGHTPTGTRTYYLEPQVLGIVASNVPTIVQTHTHSSGAATRQPRFST